MGRHLAIVAIAMLLGGACSKNNGPSRDDYEGVSNALDDHSPRHDSEPSTDLPGVDVSALDASERKRFGTLLDRLPSPCGASHSLRTSVAEDQSCKRAPFAARYVATLIGEAEDDLTIRAQYDARYRNDKHAEFSFETTAFHGTRGAPIVVVEFLDYG